MSRTFRRSAADRGSMLNVLERVPPSGSGEQAAKQVLQVMVVGEILF